MSQELERVYTIPLGKVLISQSQHRAVRAINMIKEFARHHMKVEIIKIDEELAQQIWSRGVRSPPRKIKVRMSKTDEGYVLVSPFTDDVEPKVTPEKETKKVEDAKEAPAKEAPAKEAPAKEAPAKEAPAKEAPAKEAPAKEAPAKEAPAKEAPAKEAPAKEAPAKD